jgi:hypothetical protein
MMQQIGVVPPFAAKDQTAAKAQAVAAAAR